MTPTEPPANEPTPSEPAPPEPSPADAPPPSLAWVAPAASAPPSTPPPMLASTPPGAPTPSAPWAPPAGVGPAPKQTVNGFAVASLVLGLCCWCAFVPGILAVVFGNVALGKIATSEGREKGRGMAIAGIVLGWISIAVLAGLAIAWLGYGISNL